MILTFGHGQSFRHVVDILEPGLQANGGGLEARSFGRGLQLSQANAQRVVDELAHALALRVLKSSEQLGDVRFQR